MEPDQQDRDQLEVVVEAKAEAEWLAIKPEPDQVAFASALNPVVRDELPTSQECLAMNKSVLNAPPKWLENKRGKF